MRKKSIALMTLVVLLAVSVTFSKGSISFAKTLEDIQREIEELKDQQNNLKDQKSDISSEKSTIENEIARNIAKQKEIRGLIQQLDNHITETTKQLVEKEEEIHETENDIEELTGSIEDLQQKIATRDIMLKDRLRNLQKNGGQINYLDVVLGAQDFGDLLNRSTAVSKIMDQDKRIMDKQAEEKQDLEVQQQLLEDKKENLVAKKDELESIKADLEKQKQSQITLVAQLEQEEETLHSNKMSLEEQAEILAAQQNSVQQLLKKAEQEKKRLEQVNQNPNGKLFINPSDGWLTSGYGKRWGSMHYGIDVAKAGTVPIVSVADGIVSRSYRSASYGEVVFITHYLGGKFYTTVYAHMRYGSRTVSDGDEVKQGQRIGYMGNTGDSTGQHLHFELHLGPRWTADKSNAVNPLKYLSY
ncbi:murein hydrolase activator EnvC family protein [Salirhabdus salicampi]|uniref:murein hydrolase activator EnvC family protein n=1 Tax=Salirhabdus salicampi TaxID=476102 RepID=UPI0020C57C6C|nr:M23 family metallopeptidase [Salirhabdus salicampi]MCP8617618.1 peptidoglycan DD-metalloendopeptidase family protein [Salirhabdus salicampi]